MSKFTEEILTMLSNLGALNEKKAASRELLASSDTLRGINVESEIARLVDGGYVKTIDDKVYLTQSGLLRAMSRFS
jgi:hypothetical protein